MQKAVSPANIEAMLPLHSDIADSAVRVIQLTKRCRVSSAPS